MKKSIVILVAAIFITGTVITSCNSSAEKVEEAQENVAEANQDLDKANEEYLKDVATYRIQTAERVEANNKAISEFNEKAEHEKKEVREEYKKKIAELEQKNHAMKIKMDEYKAESKDNWETFKTEFNHDMDELGQAFKNLTVKNTK